MLDLCLKYLEGTTLLEYVHNVDELVKLIDLFNDRACCLGRYDDVYQLVNSPEIIAVLAKIIEKPNSDLKYLHDHYYHKDRKNIAMINSIKKSYFKSLPHQIEAQTKLPKYAQNDEIQKAAQVLIASLENAHDFFRAR